VEAGGSIGGWLVDDVFDTTGSGKGGNISPADEVSRVIFFTG
jgi:hypothetical protein